MFCYVYVYIDHLAQSRMYDMKAEIFELKQTLALLFTLFNRLWFYFSNANDVDELL